MKCDDNMESKYNISSQKNPTITRKILLLSIYLLLNRCLILSIYLTMSRYLPLIRGGPHFPSWAKMIPSKIRKDQKWTAYKIQEELIESLTFINYVEGYHYPHFYVAWGELQNKYGSTNVLLKRNKKKLKVENEQRKVLTKMSHDQKRDIDHFKNIYEITKEDEA